MHLNTINIYNLTIYNIFVKFILYLKNIQKNKKNRTKNKVLFNNKFKPNDYSFLIYKIQDKS